MTYNLEDANWTERTELIIGADGVARLAGSSVAVVGLGGVGSACAEALARAHVGKLIFVDGDVVSTTNINRQIIAFTDNIGRPKAEIMVERVRRINPQCEAVAEVCWVDGSNVGDLLRLRPDFVADAIDSVGAKLDLIEACLRSQIPIVSSMGAGNRLDPTAFAIADISKTHTCPMAGVSDRGCAGA
ncbi:MAG TPA: ThiF family adenylyltransferase, partial [Bacillota bacterium]|nr:ThiF family adenylyltransferase [Bacillota bacterium]